VVRKPPGFNGGVVGAFASRHHALAKISPNRLMLASDFSNSSPGQWQRIMKWSMPSASR